MDCPPLADKDFIADFKILMKLAEIFFIGGE